MRCPCKPLLHVCTLAACIIASFGLVQHSGLFRLELPRPGSTAERLDFVQEAPATVCIFLAEGCRISQDYSPTLRELYREFSVQGVEFRGVFPNTFSSDSAVSYYRQKYNIPFTLLLDPRQELCDILGARITPEAVVLLPSGEIVYRGRIDNLFYALGRRRPKVSSRDLEAALHDILAGREPAIAETKAIGCLIERPRPAGE